MLLEDLPTMLNKLHELTEVTARTPGKLGKFLIMQHQDIVGTR